MMRSSFKRNFKLIGYNAYNMIALSILTGLFAGVVVTFYNILMELGEDTAVKLYSLILDHPAFIPLLFLGLAAGAILIGTVVRFVPMIRGSGIPQIEGAARGIIRFKWYVAMCSMFAASLACVFMGYPAGAEGPSLELGGCAGGAVSKFLRRNQMVRRMQIASGASAGLAVAFNAPVSGMIFALEEAFRSFSPHVFICAAISVVTAVFTRNAIRPALGLSVGFAFENFVFTEFDAPSCFWVAVAAAITSLVGVGFYYLVFLARRLFKRITLWKGTLKFVIPFVVAGAFGLITAYSIGGGHSFIDDIATGGTGEITVESVLGLGLAASLFIIVFIRFITAVLSMGCGVPCGVFIPMLAIGAGTGALLSALFQMAGMNGAYGDYLVIICMAAFFTCVVKAPITGIIMVFELTGQFVNFLPALLGVAVGYLIGMLFRTEAIYEKILSQYIEDEKLYSNNKKLRVSVTVNRNSQADGKAVRMLVWPANGLVTAIEKADGTTVVPDGETVMRAGDVLDFECDTDDREELVSHLYNLVGKPEKTDS